MGKLANFYYQILVKLANQRVLQLHIRLLLERLKGTRVTLLAKVLQTELYNLHLTTGIIVLHPRTRVHWVVLPVQLDVPNTEVKRWSPGQEGNYFEVQNGQVL